MRSKNFIDNVDIAMATPVRSDEGSSERLPLKLELRPVVNLQNNQFYEFCRINRDVRIERNAEGELLIMPPTGGETGARNAEVTMQLGVWAKRDGRGVIFDSSTGFLLPNRAVRSPDAAWISHSRLPALTERRRFIALCPDFVLELRSPTDDLGVLQAKLCEYLENGASLGWLIDPDARLVYVYRPETPVQQIENAVELSGDPVLPGFVLDLREIW
jgi:Uma2 family endonuclease